MSAALFDISHLHSALSNRQLVVTPNNRLRNKIQQAWGEQQPQSTWHSARVVSFSEWQEELWQALLDQGHSACHASIISADQRRYLWQQLVKNSPQGEGLLRPDPLAAQADAAYRLLELWQQPLSELPAEPQSKAGQHQSEQQQLNELSLHQWAKDFQLSLKQQGYITQEQAQQIIIQAFDGGQLTLEESITGVGFADLAPLHNDLLKAASRHLVLHSPSDSLTPTQLARTKLQSLEEELLCCALWSREQLLAAHAATGHTSKQPANLPSIGIIVPNLGQCRALAERTFTQVFEAHSLLPEMARYTLPFNFSAGTPLASTALIHDTLALLNLNRAPLQTESLCNLLTSPFWQPQPIEMEEQPESLAARPENDSQNSGQVDHQGTAEQSPAITELITCLQQQGKNQLRGGEFRHHCTNFSPALAQKLQASEDLRRRAPRQAPLADWFNLFDRQLTQLGWPGQRRLDSQEYQQIVQWQQLQEQLLDLDALSVNFSLIEALGELQRAACSTHFQAQTPNSPIQILGALEGAGLRFDHCWVIGLQDHNWPPSPSPNPLLPLELQQRLHMPHATPERELAYAQTLTDGYRHCAEQVIFSTAKYSGELALQPSPLISDIALSDWHTLISPQLDNKQTVGELNSGLLQHYRQLEDSRQLELLDSRFGPELKREAGKPVVGGSGILQQQASCPFVAFARYRLGAKSPLPASIGLSPIERGIILHQVLADIWQELKTSSRLATLHDSQLDQLIEQAITEALTPWQKKRPDQLGKHYCQLEKDRLQQLLRDWFNLERQRHPFRVCAVEKSVRVEFAGLTLDLQIDRIDQLDSRIENPIDSPTDGQMTDQVNIHTDGNAFQTLLIDYKTGHPKLSKWQGQRPDEPQLPLYALTYQAIAPAIQSTPTASAVEAAKIETTVDAIAFAEINADQVQLQGLGELLHPVGGILFPAQTSRLDLPGDWPSTLEHWQQALSQLANEFIEGDARIDFKDANALRYSEEYLPLCRIAEQAAIEQRLLAGADKPQNQAAQDQTNNRAKHKPQASTPTSPQPPSGTQQELF